MKNIKKKIRFILTILLLIVSLNIIQFVILRFVFLTFFAPFLYEHKANLQVELPYKRVKCFYNTNARTYISVDKLNEISNDMSLTDLNRQRKIETLYQNAVINNLLIEKIVFELTYEIYHRPVGIAKFPDGGTSIHNVTKTFIYEWNVKENKVTKLFGSAAKILNYEDTKIYPPKIDEYLSGYECKNVFGLTSGPDANNMYTTGHLVSGISHDSYNPNMQIIVLLDKNKKYGNLYKSIKLKDLQIENPRHYNARFWDINTLF